MSWSIAIELDGKDTRGSTVDASFPLALQVYAMPGHEQSMERREIVPDVGT